MITLAGAATQLRAAIDGRLPGVEAQCAMAPRPRPGWVPGELPTATRPAAALLLLIPGERPGLAHVVLTVRAGGLRHGGQVSLPGGAVERGEAIEAAALREANEEIGLSPQVVEILGPLTPLHVMVSGFDLHPVAGICQERPVLRPAPDEVERILEIPLEDLTRPTDIGHMPMDHHGLRTRAPYFAVRGERVWGATAMILSELLWIVGREVDPWR